MRNISYNIADLFESVAQQIPEREALVCADQRRSYAELNKRADKLATALTARGVKPGEHVACYLRNCVEYVETLLACFKLRAVPININYRYVQHELDYLFTNADIVAAVVQPEFQTAAQQLLSHDSNPLHSLLVTDYGSNGLEGTFCYEALLDAAAPAAAIARSDEDKFVLYTGGTTGHPKGVVWEHKALYFATLGGDGRGHPNGAITAPGQVAERIAPEGRYITMAPLAPLMHGAAWWPTMSALLAGNRVVLYHGKTFDADEVVSLMQRERVNAIAMVGDAMAIPLLQALQQLPAPLPGLRVIGSGGAVFSHWVQQALRELYPEAMVLNAFGSSETGAQGNDSGTDRRSETLGSLPVSDIINVVDDSLQFIAPGSDQVGTIVKSGYIPIAYYGDPEATARTFITIARRRWVHTGDMAQVTPDGLIRVLGRGSNCINTGGEKVFPEEVEQVLKSHPQVMDALVVALPDERFGSAVAAVVATKNDTLISTERLAGHCREQLAGYKIPRHWRFGSKIARSPAGKPDYRWASAQFAD